MPPIGARSLSEGGTAFPPRAPMGEGGSGSPLGHLWAKGDQDPPSGTPQYRCVCSGDMKSPAQTEVWRPRLIAARVGCAWATSCRPCEGRDLPAPVKTKGPPTRPAARGRLRRPDSNRRPSGYEPDELPLLHAADGV